MGRPESVSGRRTESELLLRPSVVRAVSVAKSQLTARWRHRTLVRESRAAAELAFSKYGDLLADGAWRRLSVRRAKPGKPLVTMQRPIQALLIHESVDDAEALAACGFSESTGLRARETWTDDVIALMPTSVERQTGFRATVVLPRHSKKEVLFDLDGERVLRISETLFTPEYEALRTAFAKHVPSVPFEVLPGRHRILESFVQGDLFRYASGEAKQHHLAQLLECLPEVARESGVGDSVEWLSSAIDASGERLRAAEHRDDLLAWLGSSRLSPSHGDLTGANVILTGQGPVCVDFGAVGWRPAWYDGLKFGLDTMRAVETSGERDVIAIDELLNAFLRQAIPRPLPDGWRRLASLALQVLGGGVPPKPWLDLSN